MALEIQFPDPNLAEDDGLVAVGGSLSSEFLLAAYSQGLFPWFNEGEPLLWWSPNPRMVLFPQDFKCAQSLKQTLKSGKFQVRIDENFEAVIKACAGVNRTGQKGTWITKDIVSAYIRLHKEGYAHSVETYYQRKLVGGLYGVSLGKAFFGESMFFLERDASKVALFHLNELMLSWDFDFIDAQQSTNHLKRLGGVDIARDKFLDLLMKTLKNPTKKGKWEF
jgi:leucyl/phenylalanyl-tRNA--protein transferase